MYFGAQVQEVSTNDDTNFWTMALVKYLQAVIANVEAKLGPNERLPTRFDTPFSSGYHPVEDTTPELDTNGLQYYQEMIVFCDGVLRLDMLISCIVVHTFSIT